MERKLNNEKRHVVLGATGGLGTNLVLELVSQGKNVVIVARNMEEARRKFQNFNVDYYQADLLNAKQAMNAVKKASIVYNCVGFPYTHWLKLFPKLNRNIIQAVKQNNAVLVYSDNLYMYGKMQGNFITENHPISNESKKGELRHLLAEEILDAHRRGEIRAVIARSGDFFGPHVRNGFTDPLFHNPLRNKPATWIGNGDQPHSLIYVKDMAKAMIKLGENPDSYGSIWHISGDSPVSGKEFVSLIESTLNKGPIKLKILTPPMIRLLSVFVPVVKELKELLFEWNYPFVINGMKFQRKFPEYQPTNHSIAISKTLEWYKREK